MSNNWNFKLFVNTFHGNYFVFTSNAYSVYCTFSWYTADITMHLKPTLYDALYCYNVIVIVKISKLNLILIVAGLFLCNTHLQRKKRFQRPSTILYVTIFVLFYAVYKNKSWTHKLGEFINHATGAIPLIYEFWKVSCTASHLLLINAKVVLRHLDT